MKNLTTFFTHAGFQGDALKQILDSFIPKEFKKGSFFIEEGQISGHLGFVEKGLFQYYLLVDGEEKTTYSTTEGNLLASLVSLFRQTPAREGIRAVKNSKIYLLSKKAIQELQNEVPGFKDFYIGLLEYQIGCIDDSRMDAIALTATHRYEKLIQEEPELLQQIPLKYIASILGVSERHLSRIRKEI